MLGFLFRRLGAAAILVFVLTSLTFVLVFSSAQNAARNILGESASQEQVDALNRELGLDQPLLVQYTTWLGKAVTGNLGKSWTSNEQVTSAIASRLPVTLSMVITAITVMTIISVLLGVAAAVYGGGLDRLIQFISVLGFSLPNFWIALILVLTFAVSLRWFPATGYVPLTRSVGGWASSLALPVAALVVGGIASAAQQVRGAVIDVLEQDYIRTLRARGVSPRSILFRHALRNATPPALTVISLQFIALLSGAVIIERVFAIPGMGSLTVDASLSGDTPIVMGIVIVLVVLVSLVNLLIDLANAWVNPKVRLR
jgi:peptide/nickel transport system permease protein